MLSECLKIVGIYKNIYLITFSLFLYILFRIIKKLKKKKRFSLKCPNHAIFIECILDSTNDCTEFFLGPKQINEIKN